MFFKKPIVLDCYTSDKVAYTFYKPEFGINNLPKWWKELPKKTDNFESNMRGCAGVIDFFKKGITFKVTNSLEFHVNNQEVFWNGNVESSSVVFHSEKQRGSYLNNCYNPKIALPWRIRCKEEIYFLATTPTWSMENSDLVIPTQGVLEYKYNVSVNSNFFLKKTDSSYNFFIEEGTPVFIIFPLSDRKVILNYHLVSEKEFLDLSQYNNAAKFKYFKSKKALQENEKKCPFSFW